MQSSRPHQETSVKKSKYINADGTCLTTHFQKAVCSISLSERLTLGMIPEGRRLVEENLVPQLTFELVVQNSQLLRVVSNDETTGVESSSLINTTSAGGREKMCQSYLKVKIDGNNLDEGVHEIGRKKVFRLRVGTEPACNDGTTGRV